MSFLDSIVGSLGGAAGGQRQGQAIVSAVLQMLQSHPGGASGVVSALEQAGLGAIASSWLQQGANQPIGAQQIQQALGSGAVNQVASSLGVNPAQAAGHIADILPHVMDHLSPGGALPADGGLGGLGGLLGQLGVRL